MSYVYSLVLPGTATGHYNTAVVSKVHWYRGTKFSTAVRTAVHSRIPNLEVLARRASL